MCVSSVDGIEFRHVRFLGVYSLNVRVTLTIWTNDVEAIPFWVIGILV